MTSKSGGVCRRVPPPGLTVTVWQALSRLRNRSRHRKKVFLHRFGKAFREKAIIIFLGSRRLAFKNSEILPSSLGEAEIEFMMQWVLKGVLWQDTAGESGGEVDEASPDERSGAGR